MHQSSEYSLSGAFLLLPLIGFIIFFTVHYLTNAAKKPSLYGGGNKWSRFIRTNCTVLNEIYWPPIWCFQSHLITALSAVFRKSHSRLEFHRELIPTPDGGQLALDWYDPDGAERTRPIAVFIPAFMTHSRAEYFRTLIPACHRLGYRSVVVNYRGLGGTELINGQVSGIANHLDQHTAFSHIRKSFPDASRVVGVGISLGGTVLAGYLAKWGSEAQVDAAFLVSICWNLARGTRQLERGLLNRRINRMLTQMLVGKFIRHRIHFEHRFDVRAVAKCRTLREFDRMVTINMFSYGSIEEFYHAASVEGRVDQIKVPTLCINSADDAFAPKEDLPIEEVSKSDCVAMILTARGGHIGFMEGLMPTLAPSFYLERLFTQYMSALDRLPDNPRDMF